MKKLFFALVISLSFSASSQAIEQMACVNIDKVIDCIINSNSDRQQEPGRWGQVKIVKLNGLKSFVMVEDTYASGSYNPTYWGFIYNHHTKWLKHVTESTSLIGPDVDPKSNVIVELGKRAADSDTGVILFSRIDLKNDRLVPLKTFSTKDTTGQGKYIDENNNKDQASGYLERAGNYILEKNYNFPSVASTITTKLTPEAVKK